MRLLVTAGDVRTIKDQNWLNDVIMSYYIRVHLPQHVRTFVMDANVFGHIYSEFVQVERKIGLAHERCCGITATFPYEKYNHVVLPICMGNHWTLPLGKTLCEAPAFVVRGVRTSPAQINHDDCGVFVLYFIKRTVEAFQTGNTLLLSDIKKICTSPRSVRFNAKLMRKQPDTNARDGSLEYGSRLIQYMYYTYT
ncbi:hypothetical protein PHYSODRAFT_494003 [Phytophthora sojae]|uniref:Ubiquitin-like protease family profile domain-containing protein n=1 Tax=Phytophthora sojae (strain P6497) TaxID=1094619 RepID=G4ZB49_PHYSP|nr:hypothetical protein PHYSODRAFT_494003 [Phytophthora sojae]EGZ22015.1 hypothetical protein PHYSODRAFT_494003 [Phytophthora sojae]|eukprot:XP_009524732.1 hypothetical protein PHYSODRAFT_494003 [Phytophthora sojae]